MINIVKTKPFLKWAGGKSQLIKEIEKYYPFENGVITKYAEPFVGGGAVLFDILNRFDLEDVYIGDINAELINCYTTIKDYIDDLIDILDEIQEDYLNFDINERKNYYATKRNEFNELKINNNKKENIRKAALMIFLNKTCFNGLYRVNSKGLFNVPIGSYKRPLICDEVNLTAISNKLQGVKISCCDYQDSFKFIDNKTFVYLDPPYRPLSATSNFVSYTENLFDDEAQKKLAEFVHGLHQKGAKVVVSNSDPKNSDSEDNFFDDIYMAYDIKRVEANRMINCNSSSRGKIKELLIANF